MGARPVSFHIILSGRQDVIRFCRITYSELNNRKMNADFFYWVAVTSYLIQPRFLERRTMVTASMLMARLLVLNPYLNGDLAQLERLPKYDFVEVRSISLNRLAAVRAVLYRMYVFK